MDDNTYIASGNLEFYVAGLLSEEENLEVHERAIKSTAVMQEIEEIEAAVLALAKTTSPGITYSFTSIKEKLNLGNKETKVVDITKKEEKGSNLFRYVGWAASILLAVGLFYMFNQNQELQSQIEVVDQEKQTLEQQVIETESSYERTQELLNSIRDQNNTVVALGGQAVSPTSYAKAYWNKEDQRVIIDAQGLPEPPEGMVYQVWSLKLSPLTPTSLGLLEDFATDENKLFALSNVNESEAFGITLEPAGGSESPNLEQLYTLGAVATS